jgi:drug/metabolite transporter (DMT)-like permease
VVGLIPIVTSLAAVVRHGERPRPLFWLASALGVLAVVVFAAAEGAGRPQLADLWLLFAMISAGIGYAEGGRLARDMGGWRVICWALLLAAPILAVPVGLDVAHRSLDVSARAWSGFAYVSVISMFLAFFAWYKSLALGGIAAGGQMLLFQPLLSALWAALLLGESIAPRAWVAALLVLGSVALSRWSQVHPRSP